MGGLLGAYGVASLVVRVHLGEAVGEVDHGVFDVREELHCRVGMMMVCGGG